MTARQVSVGIVAGALVMGSSVQRAGAQTPEVLTNESVISMTAANVNRDLLMAKINTTKNTFDVTVDGLISLYQGKVNNNVIRSMITAAANSKLGPGAPKNELLDNEAVVRVVLAKVPRDVIITKIQGTKCKFDTTSSGLVSLTQAKVPNDVIQAMISKGGAKN